MATTFPTTKVEHLIQQGWRRRLLVLAVDQSALALAAVFAGFVLLIVLGTQILAWPWLLAIAAVGIGLTVFGVRRRLSDEYTVAQMMDQRLALNDSLSTAWFLRSSHPDQSPTVMDYQLTRAEQLAQTADPAAAFPFQRQRAWLITGALGLLAVGLFSARYLVTRQLSLQHSFLPLAVTQVFENVRQGLAEKIHNQQASDTGKLKGLPPATVGQDAQPRPPAAKPEPGQSPSQQQAKGGEGNSKSNESPDQNSLQAKNADGQGGDSKRNSDAQGSKSGANPEAGNKPPSDQGQPQQQDGKQQENSGQQQHSPSMMDRMRDAVSSVMSKMKSDNKSQESQNGAEKNADGQKGSDQSASKDQNGDGQKESGKEQSAQEQSSGQQQGQGSAKAQAAGKDSAQASDKKGSDAQSGVGHSDGDKEVKAAEQAKAMGKLAEIIGKRSASLTGDMQIEPSGKQQLQTGYTHEQGQHADLGGEINRDEVSVEDQEYVRQYMELVRKKPVKGTTSH